MSVSDSLRFLLVFSSPVTDLVLIYEPLIFPASVARWLTLHNWPLNFWIVLKLNDASLHGSLYSLAVTMENVCCLSVVTETCFD
jgi:hypothetical protein